MTQAQALDILKMGHNVFLTGAAGSGKTYVLNQFIDHLAENKITAGVTASTGIASTHLNGMTIHSWSGIGIRDELTKSDKKKMQDNSQLSKRLRDSKILIIDEISMLHGNTLNMIDEVCRLLKDKEKPFGGLQVVLCGDLFQLPPVTKYVPGEERAPTNFAHTSDAWKNASLKVCYLSEQHRQGTDELVGILNAIRDDEVEEFHADTLMQRKGVEVKDNEIITKLYTHNADVDTINIQELKKLDGEERSFETERVKGGQSITDRLIASCLAPENLSLKRGSEVMFVANNPQQNYVNGTRGQVVNFTKEDGYPIVETRDDRIIVAKPFSWKLQDGEKVRAEISQIPLRLAWAITVHKSQGMSLDAAEIDIGKSFEPGMGYVALSRVSSLDGLYIKDINNMALQMHPEVKSFDGILRDKSTQLSSHIEGMNKDDINKLHDRVIKALASTKSSSQKAKNEPDNYDKELFQKLRKWRADTAKDASLPAFVVLHDSTLKHLSDRKPKKLEDLGSIPGFGSTKIKKYGQEVLDIIE